MKTAVIVGSREAGALLDTLPDAAPVRPDALPARFEAAAVIDACHPCERETPPAVAARLNGLPLLRFRRPAWVPTPKDRWLGVADAEAAHAALAPEWNRIFLCLGAGDRVPFGGDPTRWYLVRTSAGDAAMPPDHLVTAKAGPFSVEEECALMLENRIDALVTRNAGGEGAIPKVLAARRLGLPVVMLDRPPALGAEASTVGEVLAWLDALPSR